MRQREFDRVCQCQIDQSFGSESTDPSNLPFTIALKLRLSSDYNTVHDWLKHAPCEFWRDENLMWSSLATYLRNSVNAQHEVWAL